MWFYHVLSEGLRLLPAFSILSIRPFPTQPQDPVGAPAYVSARGEGGKGVKGFLESPPIAFYLKVLGYCCVQGRLR